MCVHRVILRTEWGHSFKNIFYDLTTETMLNYCLVSLSHDSTCNESLVSLSKASTQRNCQKIMLQVNMLQTNVCSPNQSGVVLHHQHLFLYMSAYPPQFSPFAFFNSSTTVSWPIIRIYWLGWQKKRVKKREISLSKNSYNTASGQCLPLLYLQGFMYFE